MPKHRPEAEQAIKRAIRDTRALDPLITQNKLVTTLEKKFDHTFDPRYINRLSEKVMKQVHLEADHKAIEQRLSETRETFRLCREKLLRILYWTKDDESFTKPDADAVVNAVKALVQLDLMILDAELNAGMYKKNAETIEAELRYKPLPPELREQIVLTYRNWGRLPEATIARIVPAEVIEVTTP